MRKVVVQVFSKDGTGRSRATREPLENNRRDVSLKGNVVIRSSDGLEMRTNTLGWDNEQRALGHGRRRGRSAAEGTTITGKGLAGPACRKRLPPSAGTCGW